MRILFVSNCSYPYSGTCTNIINKLLYDGDLINKFKKIDIICGKENPKEKDYEEVDGIKVYRVISYSLYPRTMLNMLFAESIFHFTLAIIQKAIFHIEDKLLNNSIGDRFAVKAFYNKMKEINASSYDLIISMSGRYYTSIAAAKYCRNHNVPFLFYQVDPCASNQYLPQKSLKYRLKIEKDIYETAKYIITTNLIHNDVKKYLPNKLCAKIKELNFPLITEQKQKFAVTQNSEKTICLFSGSIYGGIRNPQYTLSLFKELVKSGLVELHFAGMKPEELENADFVICHGILSLEDAMKLNSQADFLINIGNSVTNQVPSKIFDYISLGKPIVNVSKNNNCPTIEYLNKYPLSITLFEKPDIFDIQVKLLKDFIIKNKGKQIPFSMIKEVYNDCTPEYCANELLNLINRLELRK